jgi:hypothetical protein
MAKAIPILQSPDYAWKDYEFGYCLNLIRTQGNADVGRDPKTIASYLRLQASSAFRDGALVYTWFQHLPGFRTVHLNLV